MTLLSPLQLEHSVFTEFHLELVPTPPDEDGALNLYASFGESTFVTESSFEKIAPESTPEGLRSSQPRYGVQLTVVLAPKNEEKPLFPYRARVCASGIFTCAFPEEEEKRDAIVFVNGTSMLYSMIREQLLTMSGRFGAPASLMLPTVHFAKLAQQMEERRKAGAAAEQSKDK
jgi:preprotein translocase subunit SecB